MRVIYRGVIFVCQDWPKSPPSFSPIFQRGFPRVYNLRWPSSIFCRTPGNVARPSVSPACIISCPPYAPVLASGCDKWFCFHHKRSSDLAWFLYTATRHSGCTVFRMHLKPCYCVVSSYLQTKVSKARYYDKNGSEQATREFIAVGGPE